MAGLNYDETSQTNSAEALVPADWESLRCSVEAETGMDFSGKRLERLQAAVRKTFPHLDMKSDLSRLPSQAERQPGWWDRLSVELTVGESFFFRNEHHFRALREHIIPEIVRDNSEAREVRVWSAGCATGEEPHSIAILLDQILGTDPSWRVSVLGTDLNPEFLERAREASYRPWSFRQTTIQTDRRYFTPDGEMFRLAPRLTKHVRYAYLNLVKDVYPSPLTGTMGLDLIVFRNVAIYLKPEVTKAIILRMHRALRPGGWLLLGETEVCLASAGEFEVRRFGQATFHQKPHDRSVSAAVEISQQSPLPVLATVSFGSDYSRLSVPSLPEWVPLPKPKTRAERNVGDALEHRRSIVAEHAGGVSPEEATWDRVERLVASRKTDDARRTIDRVGNFRERARLRLRYVRALLACAEIGHARQMLDLCLKENPLLLDAQLLSAGFAEEAGDLSAAEQACRRAIYIEPKAAMAHFHLALVLDRKGDRLKAIRSLTTTVKLIDGEDPHAMVEYGEGVCNGRLREMASILLRARS